MTPPQSQQASYDLAIFSALVDVLPDECDRAVLQVVRTPSGNGESLALSITGSGLPASVEVSEDLFAAVRELSLYLQGAGHDLREATYTVVLAPDGNWDTKAAFYYHDGDAE